MPHRLCPICNQPGRLVVDIGSESVEYHLCEPCEHVWSHSKLDPNAPAVSVTPLPSVLREKQPTDTGEITTPHHRRSRIR